ncbi:hypothetical protein ABPG72_019142 [Tetrahymena utriculariae]
MVLHYQSTIMFIFSKIYIVAITRDIISNILVFTSKAIILKSFYTVQTITFKQIIRTHHITNGLLIFRTTIQFIFIQVTEYRFFRINFSFSRNYEFDFTLGAGFKLVSKSLFNLVKFTNLFLKSTCRTLKFQRFFSYSLTIIIQCGPRRYYALVRQENQKQCSYFFVSLIYFIFFQLDVCFLSNIKTMSEKNKFKQSHIHL